MACKVDTVLPIAYTKRSLTQLSKIEYKNRSSISVPWLGLASSSTSRFRFLPPYLRFLEARLLNTSDIPCGMAIMTICQDTELNLSHLLVDHSIISISTYRVNGSYRRLVREY